MTQFTAQTFSQRATFVSTVRVEKVHQFTGALDGRAYFGGAVEWRIPVQSVRVLSGAGVFRGRVKVSKQTPFGAFRDFSHYLDNMADPAMVLIGPESSGQTTFDAAAPSNMRRVWVSVTPPREYPTTTEPQAWPRAAFASVGVRVNQMDTTTYQYVDGAQVEVSPLAQNGPTAYAPARSLNIKVRPDRLNYCTNPAFRATSGTVEVRRNLAQHPRAALAGGTGWNTNNVAYWTVTKGVAITGHPLGITTAAKTVPVTTGSTTIASISGMDSLGATTTSRGFGVWIWATAAGTATLYSDGAGPDERYISVPAQTWTWVTSGGSDTGNSILVLNRTSGNADPATDYLLTTGCVAEAGAVPANFFDGTTPAADGLTYSWTGAADQSASIATGNKVASASDLRVHQLAPSGGLVIPANNNNNSNDNWQSVGGDVGAVRLGLLPGKTYTFSAEGHALADDVGEHPTRARRIVVFTKAPSVNGGIYVESMSATVPVQGDRPGTRVAVSVTLPPDTTEAFVRLYNGSAKRDVRWYDLLVEDGAVAGTYFDGSFGTDYIWESGKAADAGASFYYRDRQARRYLLDRVLQENCPLGVIPAVPQFAVLPSE